MLAQTRAEVRAGQPAPADSDPRITWLPLGLSDTPALLRAAQGAQVVVHALNPRQYTDAAWTAEAPALLDTTLQLAHALGATLMMPGNVYNYGTQLPEHLCEDTPQTPDHTKARVRVAMEQRLQQAANEKGVRSIVIRAGDFFGQGQGSWLDLVIAKQLQRGTVTLPGPRDVPHAWAYLPDLAAAFVRVADQHAQLPTFATLHFQGHTLTLDDWVRGLQVGRPPLRVKRLPWPLLQALALFSPTMRSLCGLRYLWTRPHALDNSRLTALIGAEPHTDYATALQQALRDLGHTPAIPLATAHALPASITTPA